MHTTTAARNVWHFKQIISCQFILKSRDKSVCTEARSKELSRTRLQISVFRSQQITAGLDLARAWLVAVPKILFAVCGQTQQGTHTSETPMQNALVAVVPEPLLLASLQLGPSLLHYSLPSCLCKDSGQVREFSSNLLCCYLRRVNCSKSDVSCYCMYH